MLEFMRARGSSETLLRFHSECCCPCVAVGLLLSGVGVRGVSIWDTCKETKCQLGLSLQNSTILHFTKWFVLFLLESQI